MNNNIKFRVHTDVGQDKKLDIHLQQNVGILQVLSLNINQSDAYINRSSNYGVVVGRILANDAFGVENVKVSVFIPVTDDYYVSRIKSVYPYKDLNKTNPIDNKRYNLLPNEIADECHTDVGSFPNKRLVLDENTYIEVFEKYYKYTTVTNKAGDYMIYGVPTGSQQIHIDVDLSDIGILSQKPRDFFYKGYGEKLFKNAEQFKDGTNLDNLVQLITQNKTIEVYPFWGDESTDTVALTRCDMNISYKFESTCVFIGSVVTDGDDNSIGSNCYPSRYAGKNSKLKAGEGTIEMIRKTPDGYVEEYNIDGGRLIDSDGVWCYQIPMNLDYIQTDEEGNLIPSQDPNKGIATRARVRFRMSIDEMSGDGSSKHRAEYLVPNNPLIDESDSEMDNLVINKGLKFNGVNLNEQYVYGSETNESDFRDLQWNKVYTVKSYIPRFVSGASKVKGKFLAKYRENNRAFTGIKSSNTSNDNNPFPFNSFMGTISFKYKIICNIITILMDIIYEINDVWRIFSNTLVGIIRFSTFGLGKGNKLKSTKCVSFSFGDYIFIPGCKDGHKKATIEAKHCNEKDVHCVWSNDEADQLIQQHLAEEFDVVDLDFGNDWVNGVLYFPLWHWLKKKKRVFFWGLFSKRAKDQFCNCDKGSSTSIIFHYLYKFTHKVNKIDTSSQKDTISSLNMQTGFVKQFYNKDNVDIYYYAPAVISKSNERTGSGINTLDGVSYMVRLFSTDIVLIGSLMDDDMDGVSKLFRALPSTTANVPPIAGETEDDTDSSKIDTANGIDIPNGTVLSTGMDEIQRGQNNGLFFGLTCNSLYPFKHGPINVQRICELGVSADETHYYPIKNNGYIKYGLSVADALVNKIEMRDVNARAEFATYNANPLIVSRYNQLTGYKTYDYEYKYPLNFDGVMNGHSDSKTSNGSETYSQSYIDFRYGKYKHFYDIDSNGAYYGPVFNNSFYFYFGLKEGKTAIDKFRSKFYVDCVKNSELSFPIGVTIDSKGKSCRDASGTDDFPKFELSLKSASKPYELYIKDADNEEVFRVQDCNKDTIVLEKFFYVDSEYGTLKTGGNDATNDAYYIQPQVYTVYAKDSLGNTSYNKINLELSPITVELTASPFTAKSDTLDTTDENNAGSFTITSISVDGLQPVEVDNIQLLSIDSKSITDAPSSEKFWCVLINDDKYMVYIPKLDEGKTLDYEVTFGNGRWYVNTPTDISMRIVKMCPTKTSTDTIYVCLNDFAGNINTKILDYEPYIMTLNGVDIKGWVTETDVKQIATKNTSIRLDYWKPSSYNWFSKHISKNAYWGDVIDGYDEFTNDVSRSVAIDAYKFNSLFGMCNILYPSKVDSTSVMVGFNCESMNDYNTQYGTMYPYETDAENQTENSITGFNYDASSFVVIDSNTPVYCQKSYVTVSSYTPSYMYFQLEHTTDDSGKSSAKITNEILTVDLPSVKYIFNGKTTDNKNILLNGYRQSFGFYNCMVNSYSADTYNINNIQGSAPLRSYYRQYEIGDKEDENITKNWLSFDTYDARLSSCMFAFQKETGKLDIFGILNGGLYMATDESHNVISKTSSENTANTSYSFNEDEVYIANPNIYYNADIPRELYTFSITDDNSVSSAISHDTITGSLITDETKLVNVSSQTFETNGNVYYEISNNSFDIDLESNISIIEDTDENGDIVVNRDDSTVEIYGYVNKGNSFNCYIPEKLDDLYNISYGDACNTSLSNYLSNIWMNKDDSGTTSGGTGNGVTTNIFLSKGVITSVIMAIRNNYSTDGVIGCVGIRGGAQVLVDALKNRINNGDRYASDILKNAFNDIEDDYCDVSIYPVIDNTRFQPHITIGQTAMDCFANGWCDNANGYYYFAVPSRKTYIDGLSDEEKDLPMEPDTDIPMTVIERKYDKQYALHHCVNEMYIINDFTVNYQLPFEEYGTDYFVMKDGWSYYAVYQPEEGLKEMSWNTSQISGKRVNIHNYITSWKMFHPRVLKSPSIYLNYCEIVAMNDSTGECCRVTFNVDWSTKEEDKW